MNADILFILMMFTFLAVLGFAYLDLLNTRRAIRRGETSAFVHPDAGPQRQGFEPTTPE